MLAKIADLELAAMFAPDRQTEIGIRKQISETCQEYLAASKATRELSLLQISRKFDRNDNWVTRRIWDQARRKNLRRRSPAPATGRT